MSISRYLASSKIKLLAVPSSSMRLSVIRWASKEVVTEKHDPDKPIKFSTSEAGWNYKPPKYIPDDPWYKEVILWGTCFGFLIYLMFYREGNDIDDELSMPLGQRYLRVQELHLLDEKAKLVGSGNTGGSVDEELRKINALRKKYNYDS